MVRGRLGPLRAAIISVRAFTLPYRLELCEPLSEIFGLHH